jgi:hypothetical protein
MLIAQKVQSAGDKTRYEIDYTGNSDGPRCIPVNWMEEGTSLTSGSIVLDPKNNPQPTDIVIGPVTVGSNTRLIFTIAGGSANEVFTLDVQAVNSRSEIKNDTITFRIVAA